jgi:hypothetical protein
MYKTPKDAAAFDKHCYEQHVQIAQKIPGLRKYEISQGPVKARPSALAVFRLMTDAVVVEGRFFVRYFLVGRDGCRPNSVAAQSPYRLGRRR